MEINKKTQFLDKVKLYNKEFKDDYNFIINFYGDGGSFNDFLEIEIEKFDGKVTEHKFPDGSGTYKEGEKIEGKWDFEKDSDFLYDLIHESGIKLDYHGRGTEGKISYEGESDKQLFIYTDVFGESDEYDQDDDEYWDDEENEGEFHSHEIK